jgi:hypothetical protein
MVVADSTVVAVDSMAAVAGSTVVGAVDSTVVVVDSMAAVAATAVVDIANPQRTSLR